MELLKDFWGFLKVRKKYWLLPIFITLVLLTLLVMFSKAASVPFIYTLF
ncbi:MAG: DUF5989 family protein [Proteobacteria bacterium]|jgi:hypothetical protein|nr:DUF5989 family protein [Pseudomonadota bacterium]